MNVGRLSTLSAELRRRNPTLDMTLWSQCACSFAATLPEFQLLGFTAAPSGAPTYRGMIAVSSVSAFFELSFSEVVELFGEQRGFAQGVQIADVIDRFIEHKLASQARQLALAQEKTRHATDELKALLREFAASEFAVSEFVESFTARCRDVPRTPVPTRQHVSVIDLVTETS